MDDLFSSSDLDQEMLKAEREKKEKDLAKRMQDEREKKEIKKEKEEREMSVSTSENPAKEMNSRTMKTRRARPKKNLFLSINPSSSAHA